LPERGKIDQVKTGQKNTDCDAFLWEKNSLFYFFILAAGRKVDGQKKKGSIKDERRELPGGKSIWGD